MERIAKALDVRPEAFADCRIRTDQEVIHLIFNLEDDYGILPLKGSAGITVDPKSRAIEKAFRDWGEQRARLEAGSITQEEYEDWKDSYTTFTKVG